MADESKKQTDLKSNRKTTLFKVLGLFASIIIIFLLLMWKQIIVDYSSSKCLKCHSEYQDLKSLPYVHTAFASNSCESCHTKHGEEIIKTTWVEYVNSLMRVLVGKREIGKTTLQSKEEGLRPKEFSKLIRPEKELCNSCHTGETFKSWQIAKFKHPPYKVGACTSCHEPHASKYYGVTREASNNLCVTCHNITKSLQKRVLHPPFKARSCGSCHEPHASNVFVHLRMEPKYLCRVCHPKIAKLFNLPYKMEPFAKGECTKCHNPHSSNYQKLWQKGPKASDLCFSCHDGKSASNIKKFSIMAYQMKPFKEGKCLECHRPHATPDPKLLTERGNDFCYKCHGEYKKNYLPISHNTKAVNKESPAYPEHGKGSCLNCHVPHGSQWFGLVYKEIISLCTTCHNSAVFRGYKRDVPKPHIAHPVGLDIADPWRGHYLRCSSCHNPMGSGISKLRRARDDGLCIKCHNVNDPTWIRGRKKK